MWSTGARCVNQHHRAAPGSRGGVPCREATGKQVSAQKEACWELRHPSPEALSWWPSPGATQARRERLARVRAAAPVAPLSRESCWQWSWWEAWGSSLPLGTTGSTVIAVRLRPKWGMDWTQERFEESRPWRLSGGQPRNQQLQAVHENGRKEARRSGLPTSAPRKRTSTACFENEATFYCLPRRIRRAGFTKREDGSYFTCLTLKIQHLCPEYSAFKNH